MQLFYDSLCSMMRSQVQTLSTENLALLNLLLSVNTYEKQGEHDTMLVRTHDTSRIFGSESEKVGRIINFGTSGQHCDHTAT